MDALFAIYDADGSGALDYKEFSAVLFGRAPPTPTKKSKPVSAPQMAELAEQLRVKLASRGARGMIGLQRTFKIMDDDNSRSLDR